MFTETAVSTQWLEVESVRGEQKEIQMLTFISIGSGLGIMPWERK